MSKPADKPASKPQPANLRDTKRSQARFRKREVERAGRAGKTIGAERVEVDPARGVISIILAKPGEAQSDNEVEDWLSKQQQRHYENKR